jgi:hypothetical protein
MEEMCEKMRITSTTTISEIMHDDENESLNSNISIDVLARDYNIAYIDLDEGELMHWKYIKRVKLPNGKWRYYYDQSELDKAKLDATIANKNYEMAKKMDTLAEKSKKGPLGPITKRVTNSKAYKNNMSKLKSNARKKTAKYYTKSVASFPARTISKGIVNIANSLSKSSNSSKKKKSRVTYSVSSSLKPYY